MSFERLWHKSYVPGVKKTLDYEKISIPTALTNSAKRFPDNTALNYMGKRITYGELDRLVNRCARAFTDLGVAKGDKVAVIMPNLPQTIIANLAAMRIGAVAVQNNPLYTERELEYQLDDSDSVIVVTLALLVPRILKIMSGTKVRKVIGCHINSYLPFPKKQLFPYVKKAMYKKLETNDTVMVFQDLIDKYSDEPVKDETEWEELGAIVYTGGTTGVSKGVMLSHKNLSSNVQQFAAWFAADLKPGEEKLVGTFPVFHTAGFMAIQNFMIWQAYEHLMIPRPEPKALAELIKKYKPTFIPGAPTIFVGLLAEPEFRKMDFSRVKGFFSGAAPLAADTIRDLKELTGATMCEVYGQTETSPVATVTPWKGVIKPGTVGVPVADTDIRIVDMETGEKELPVGESGEVLIKGPQVMMGYYKKPEETAKTIRDGWLYTGDIGFFDEDGYLSIVDRMKDMIIAGGYNIYPIEIDNVLFDHPKILEACSFGVEDSYRGETLKAFVVTKSGESLTKEEVVQYCKEKLAPYKVPREIVFVEELPKSNVGKILRREAKEMYKKMAEEK
ncbi:MAG: long-chain fatty acid--CoA ligase [Deltaproteobacteria bacterium]|nr:long-chain fatty acid--CoA ligase [Deltaproteobacteria bacterium]